MASLRLGGFSQQYWRVTVFHSTAGAVIYLLLWMCVRMCPVLGILWKMMLKTAGTDMQGVLHFFQLVPSLNHRTENDLSDSFLNSH